MNLIDCTITRIIDTPKRYELSNGAFWLLTVEYDSWGRISETRRSFKTEEDALAVKVGDTFLS
jgi:hypothetical protein